MTYLMLADLVAVVHAVYVLFVVIGLVLIAAGAVRDWQWIRDFWFRTAHLLAIGFVLVETAAGIPCPLTVLENRLREMGGGTAYGGDFIARWVDWLIFYNLPSWLFTLAYLATGAAIALLFLIVPPRRRSRVRPFSASHEADP